MADQERRLSPADREVIRSAGTGEGLIPVGLDDLLELARFAREAKDEFDRQVEDMTPAQARQVRHLRVREGYSWRAVAETCFLEWAGDWHPPSNQLMGMALCERAATLLGEDPQEEPWN